MFINYCKIKTPKWESLDKESGIQKIQCYNPIYDLFFEMNDTNYSHIALNHKYHIVTLKEVIDLTTKKTYKRPVHVKYSPLLDPLRYMIGKYPSTADFRQLPNVGNNETCFPKLLSPYNASYIDNFFNYLSSQLLNRHQFVNGLDYYGSFLGIQAKFKMDITDDVEYLHDSTYFNRNVGGLFAIEPDVLMQREGEEEEAGDRDSRYHRKRLILSDETELEEVIDLGITDVDDSSSSFKYPAPIDLDLEEIWNTDSLHIDDTISTNSSSNSLVNYSSEEEEIEKSEESDKEEEETDTDADYEDMEEEDEGDMEEEDEEEDEEETLAYLYDFPVQMICLEKCDGTLDELFEKDEIDAEIGAAALMQIVMTLIVYQRAFHFTHNDLHTNNIMFVKTKSKFLYYFFENTWYKVPTYGRIFKIIDFGRSIYTFHGKKCCSDSFATGGDAATQYNTEPFLNENKPRLEPNYSFDLCRLGCSIYDFIIDEDDKKLDEFQKTIKRWCTDDQGKNILYMKSGRERYPHFKLYKMIARTVHSHTPSSQLQYPFFAQFEKKLSAKEKDSIYKKEIVVDIDQIPSYI